MGTTFSQCGGPDIPARAADAAFLLHWDRFYTHHDEVTLHVPLCSHWNHTSAQAWAKQKANEIKCDMEEKQIPSTYNFKVVGTVDSGRIVLMCQTTDGPGFTLEITYETD